MGDSQRVEARWRCIKEGEVSPYKLVVCLFIRENFLVNPLLQQFTMEVGGGDEEDGEEVERVTVEKNVSPKTLLLIYRLITVSKLLVVFKK